MAMSVTVLCPNGRRANIKVTPNTSILQIIEGSCEKERFDPDEYDLKHLHRILDASSTVRFTSIPNKSQLELVKRTVPRKVSNVTVNIVTESGLRLVHDFSANTSLWDILRYHEEHGNHGLLTVPSVAGAGEAMEPLIVYTMRRISGDQLKTTTLKSLGLTADKCMLRHSMQKCSASGQAHVSTPLSRPKASKEDTEKKFHSPPQAIVAPLQQQPQVVERDENSVKGDNNLQEGNVDNSHEENMEEEEQQQPQPCALDVVSHRPDVISSTQNPVPDVLQARSTLCEPDIVADKGNHSFPAPLPMDILEGHENDSVTSTSTPREGQEKPAVQEEQQKDLINMGELVIKLGPRGALLFHMDDAPSTDLSTEDDSFFQLTVDEVKSLHREHQRLLHTFEETPLMTKQMREMEKNARVLSALNQYPVTCLRIYFPDNYVIQGTFKPMETVNNVIDFVKSYLASPSHCFSLTMRHPFRLLSPEMTLVEADCIPNARLYFASEVSPPYLSEETLAKKSSFISANCALKQKRQRREMSSYTCNDDETPSVSSSSMPTASSALVSSSNETASSISQRRVHNSSATGATQKVPKWFKTGK